MATQGLLDKVDELAITYNDTVEAARQATIPILGSHIDIAVSQLRLSEDYKRWHEQQDVLKANPPPLGHEPKTSHDWFGYIDDIETRAAAPQNQTVGQVLAHLWLGNWPQSAGTSLAPGWLLAGQPDKAAEYVSLNSPQGLNFPPPDWIGEPFAKAWPQLQQAADFRAVLVAMGAMLQQAQTSLYFFGVTRIRPDAHLARLETVPKMNPAHATRLSHPATVSEPPLAIKTITHRSLLE